MKRLGIVGGAGLLGSTTAFCVAQTGVFDEIILLDIKENMVMSHVMDMGQAMCPISKTKLLKGDYEDLAECDVVLVTASLPERKVANRNEFLQDNLGIVTPICEKLKPFCKKDCVLINATNPVDVFTYVYWKLLGWDRHRVLGFCANDTLRLKWATAQVLDVDYKDLEGIAVGEHGDGQVRLYDQMKYRGESLKLTETQRAEIEKITADWFTNYQNLESKRTSGWTSGVMLARMITAIATDSGEVFPVSVSMDGEFGYSHVSFGMPCILGKDGVRSITDPGFTKEQKDALDKVAEKISGLIDGIHF